MNSISEFPDHILCHILSLLSTKEAVQTSVLSTRWRHLWLWVPRLRLWSQDFSDFNAFVRFVDRFFDPISVSCIHKLQLILGKNARSSVDDVTSCFTSWIDSATKRKIKHLRWTGNLNVNSNLPRLLFSCETLVCLSLSNVNLDDDVSVVLPCLKAMRLKHIIYPSEATLEKLISSCHVLENLKIIASHTDSKVFRVHSRSLKRLTINRHRFNVKASTNVPGVVIDAPLLRRLSIDDNKSESFLVKNMASNAKLDISLHFGLREAGVSSRRISIRNFLLGISRVRKMKICPLTFKIIHGYSELEPLPKFCYISCLCVALGPTKLKWLETFLGSCPNLKSLILKQEHLRELPSEEMNQISLPQCLLSSLQLVRFEDPIPRLAAEMNLVKYFLENSAVLEKFTLRFGSHTTTKDEILKELFEIPRRSTKCELVIL